MHAGWSWLSRGYSGGGGGAGGSRRGGSRQLKTATRLRTGRAPTTGEYWPPFAVFRNRSARNFRIEVWSRRSEYTRPAETNGLTMSAGTRRPVVMNWSPYSASRGIGVGSGLGGSWSKN